MTIAYVLVLVITILANGAEAVADLAGAAFVKENSELVGVPDSWLPMLGLLKGAGAVGLLFGLVGVRVLGIAAAVGLVLFFLGALAAHVRSRVFFNIAFPAAFEAFALASLVLMFAPLIRAHSGRRNG